MSGILEQIQADLQTVKAMLAAMSGPGSMGNVATAQLNTPSQAAPVINQPAPPANLTADQIVALIQPHVGNEAIKAELGTAMRSMGINALPETQPHQFGQLYSLFQGIIQKYTGGGVAAPVQQAAPASII